MDKKAAINLIEDTFNAHFSEEQFTLFSRNLLNDLEPKNNAYSGNYIWDDYKDHINSYKRIGKYVDPEGEALDVLIVEVKSVLKLERARTALRNFAIKHLKKFDKNYALVAFYSKADDGADWRFSFIKLDYSSFFDEEKKRVKVKEEIVPAKRYSFLVGEHEKAHTAKNQLLPLLQNIANNPSIDELEAAFSIEKVTDEFFEQYKALFTRVYQYFKDNDKIVFQLKKENPQYENVKKEVILTRFTKKLLGQIVFLYFLQKKKWLGVPRNKKWGEGDPKFLQKLFTRAQNEGKNYFKNFLQFLFYQALAKAPKNKDGYYQELEGKFPFLNGGLFEADYKWKTADISIPDYFFRSGEENEDIRTGILDVFDRYNFTIKEDEPLDKEVAVDPEMLGKVFENMLDITERKSKGAFYTPREIVHYMCQESLIHYLDNALNSSATSYQELGFNQTILFGGSTNKQGNLKLELEYKGQKLVPQKDIETYIREGHFALENDQWVATKGETKTYQYQLPESIRKNAELIDTKLTEIRICDPAIGSGAFPLGLLHELVNAMLVLKPHFSEKYLKEKLVKLDFDTAKQEINESRYVYRLKRHIIQESIYGVDIDPSAIDIARLRLWLSLVVDEEDLDPIETLPNLDYKIVCGNSLVGLTAQGADRYPQLSEELEVLKDKFYSETNDSLKKTFRNQINEKIQTVLDAAEDFDGYKIDFDFKLYFSEVWREKGGFDLIIGNPPYVQLQDKEKISPELLKIYELQVFKTFIKSGDIYSLFYEKGMRLLKPTNGILTYITSNRFCFTNYGESTRKFLSKNNLIAIINLNKIEVFKEANVGTIITIVENKEREPGKLRAGEFNSYNINSSFLEQLFKQTSFIEKKFYDSSQWGFYDSSILNLRKTIIDKGTPLSKVKDLSINRGITTGLNKVFLIPIEIANSIFKERSSYEILKPVFKGAEIKRWKCKVAKNYIFYTFTGIDIKKYPEVFEYLSQFKSELRNVYEARNGKKEWYELRKCNYYSSFEQRKIIWTRLSGINSFAISEDSEFSIDSTSFAIGENLEYYCSILNSRIVYFYFKLGGVIWGKDGIKWFGDYFDKIPILIPTPESKKVFDIPYKYLKSLAEKKDFEFSFSFFEELIDSLVFELYFPEELKIAGKEILRHLGDLKPISDEMSEEKKMAIIQIEFERLYNPNHPVRNAIETLDSIEEVRIIKEALK